MHKNRIVKGAVRYLPSEFFGVKVEIFPEKGHSKIWPAKKFFRPPNLAPGLRPCVTQPEVSINWLLQVAHALLYKLQGMHRLFLRSKRVRQHMIRVVVYRGKKCLVCP